MSWAATRTSPGTSPTLRPVGPWPSSSTASVSAPRLRAGVTTLSEGSDVVTAAFSPDATELALQRDEGGERLEVVDRRGTPLRMLRWQRRTPGRPGCLVTRRTAPGADRSLGRDHLRGRGGRGQARAAAATGGEPVPGLDERGRGPRPGRHPPSAEGVGRRAHRGEGGPARRRATTGAHADGEPRELRGGRPAARHRTPPGAPGGHTRRRGPRGGAVALPHRLRVPRRTRRGGSHPNCEPDEAVVRPGATARCTRKRPQASRRGPAGRRCGCRDQP